MGWLNSKAIESIREGGYDLARHRSKSLAEIPDIEYDLAVTMGCGGECPPVRTKVREDWSIPEPKTLSPREFQRVRDMIKKKSTSLYPTCDYLPAT